MAGDAIEGGEGDVVGEESLNFVGACFGEGGLSGEDVELSSAAGLEASFGEAETFLGLFDSFLLGFYEFKGLEVIGVGLADLEFDRTAGVGVGVDGLFALGTGLGDATPGSHAVEEVPCGSSADHPAVTSLVDIVAVGKVVDAVVGEEGKFWFVAGLGVFDGFGGEEDLFVSLLEFRAELECFGEGDGKVARAVFVKEFAVEGDLSEGLGVRRIDGDEFDE